MRRRKISSPVFIEEVFYAEVIHYIIVHINYEFICIDSLNALSLNMQTSVFKECIKTEFNTKQSSYLCIN